MRRALFTFILLMLLCGVLRADTLYLRDGSVLQGTFVGYEDGKFIFQIASGQRLELPARDVTRLVLDRNNTSDDRPDPRADPRADPRSDSRGDRPQLSRRSGAGAFDSYPPIEVALKDEWIRSEIEVARGQRIKVEASGQVYLEGRTPSSPEGLSRRDPSAPSPTDPDGALIAGVGKDDASVILIGRSREFTAERDGMLYFSINHSETKNARGAYQVRVSLERLGSGGDNVGGDNISSGSNSRARVESSTTSIPEPNRSVRERMFTIFANRQWTDTGIELEPGMNLEVVASGLIDLGNNRRVDPTGDPYRRGNTLRLPVPEARAGVLLARIHYRQGGDSNIIVVGAGNTLRVDASEYGRLWLGINDDNFGDNKGAFTVRVRW